MNQTKIISRILYYLCIVLSAGYLITLVYSMVCLLTGFAITPYKDNMFLHINYPFTEQPFLNIERNCSYIIFSFLLVLISYGIFFWLSAKVFKVFFQSKLFTKENILQLTRFYLYNIFIPLPIVIIASFFVEVESMIWGLVFIHFMLGIFCLFLANIFKQGLHLQNEQDLFI
ncbi:DUF2975 domain-containing protein [Chryseobacterium carnipullorum]|uniref:DUF2975 domain-containing protein n=1 Tax=Chryseobacterium carnipullorum TaxID=1124835 RepID=A0A376EA29_CHRCU|nr:DUF2975 domain-containing protein [Chryseobacterium carnipullorum]AZA51059.1 DUF2975 domain-containing protein [Chryseobacterium carnipullorum]AZA65917.1 DUF2975 domain-containing protein [Chryseobacterium carnipullorum]STD04169.1 Uncharacterised protein [Chryseobacterium carnipullorum]